MIQTCIETITPSVASAYLGTNTDKQRKMNKGIVSFYADMMSKGQWQLNGEAIVFDSNGSLVNGQHRCAACVKSGTPFQTVVVRNVGENSFYTFDMGFNRSRSQVFSIAGIPNSCNVSAAIAAYVKMCRFSKDSGTIDYIVSNHHGYGKISNADLLEIYNSDPMYWQKLHNDITRLYSQCRILPTSVVCGIVAFLNKQKGYDYTYALGFFEQLYVEESTKLDVIRTLRKKLINDKFGKVKMSMLYRTQLLIKAWDYYKAGASPKTLRWDKDNERVRCFE